MIKQQTIKAPIHFEGIALHCGKMSFVEIRPAAPDTGIIFFKGQNKIPALASFVSDTSRGTTLSGEVSVVEHLLSAAYGLQIDNLEIIMDQSEPPAMDGSSLEYVKAFISAGIILQDAQKKIIRLSERIELSSGDSKIAYIPSDGFRVEATINYGQTHVGTQTAVYDESKDSFEDEIAPARTFGLLCEVEQLKSKGLALGASMDNAIAITDNGYSVPLRFPNELARHKILDIIGDMALAGGKIYGTIVSHKAGHRLNTELARRLLNARS